MDTFLHILERSVYHLVGGMALLPVLQAAWYECRRKGWLPRLRGAVFALVPAIVVPGHRGDPGAVRCVPPGQSVVEVLDRLSDLGGRAGPDGVAAGALPGAQHGMDVRGVRTVAPLAGLMLLTVRREVSLPSRTRGTMLIDGHPHAFTLEDRVRPDGQKVRGETAIPAGRYRCAPREAGRVYDAYRRRWPDHRGVIHLQDVPGFTFIYIHGGVTVKDTHGCVLVGYGFDMDREALSRSRAAYIALYRRVVDSLYHGDLVVILD